MKFSTRRDAEMPAEALFDAVSDPQRLERMVIRRGAEVQRLDPGVQGGMAWEIGFDWRGRERVIRLAVTRHDRPEAMRLSGASESFDLVTDLTVVALSKARSRLVVEVDLRPRTMKARLLVQTAKLGKAQLDRRFETHVANIVDQLVAEYQADRA